MQEPTIDQLRARELERLLEEQREDLASAIREFDVLVERLRDMAHVVAVAEKVCDNPSVANRDRLRAELAAFKGGL